MNRAVFLDRDGVINLKGKSYYVFNEDDFHINPGVTESLRYFTARGFLNIIITNQGGIARGVYTVDQLEKLHSKMVDMLRNDGAVLDDIFYCPHHPEVSACDCRKPGTLMFEMAIEKHGIDPAMSFMIGDSISDIEAAEKMGIRGILIPTNANMMDLVIKTGKI
jgi:D-glycero-D-manno-heptose 1,7-bisphosphate phosphatase